MLFRSGESHKREMKTPIRNSFTVEEVAEKLNCTKENVYKMLKYGNLDAFRLGSWKDLRIPDYALADFIERMKIRNEEIKNG